MTAVTCIVEQLAEAVAVDDDRTFLPHGGLTKAALARCDGTTQRIDMTAHHGILTYDPSEFLITARAGTRIAELQAALAEHGQYLPCDPLFGKAGATLGGTLASGISGSSRLLYGGLRDFVMEVELIDGTGSLVRGGGKVVKNAAGFDLPKLLVGSYGRLGIITEATFKVFPQPPAFATLKVACKNLAIALERSQTLLAKPLPIAALDLRTTAVTVEPSHWELLARCGAPAASLPAVLERMQKLLGCTGDCLTHQADAMLWQEQAEFAEHPVGENESLLRVAMHPALMTEFDRQLRTLPVAATAVYTGGASVAWVRYQCGALTEIDRLLSSLKLSGIAVLDCEEQPATQIGLGQPNWRISANRIQKALDPRQRFLPY